MPKRRLPSRAEIITTDFIECLNEVKFKNIEDISRDLIRIYPGRRNQHIRERTKDFWDTIISTANLIITLAEFIPFLRNWQKVTREIIEEYQMITNSQKFENIGEFLSSLLVFLNKLQREQSNNHKSNLLLLICL